MEEEKEIQENSNETKSIQSHITDKKEKFIQKSRDNPWFLSTVVLGVLLLALFISNAGFTGQITGGTIMSPKEVGNKLVDFAISNGADAKLVDVTEDGSFYAVKILLKGEELTLYVTKDGKYFSQQLYPLVVKDTPTKPTSTEVPKSDKPTAELFVMTHCPFGTQAEKGFIPVVRLLETVADVKIRFVHYFMHTNNQEEVETPRQVCIREEQPEKYLDYLECFLEDGDGSRCEKKIGIDVSAMNNCIDSEKWEDYYEEDSKLSKEYGVQGSPTLVINEVIAQSGRDSTSYLEAVCSAFNTEATECSTELSSVAPSPGFGYGTGTQNSAQC